MAWLYTIVFAGLMFSSGGSLPKFNDNAEADVKNIVVAADEIERFEQTYPLDANGRVSVSNVNGSITVETWERAEVKLEYVKNADTKENLSDVNVKINARQDSFKVETEYESMNGRNNKSYKRLEVEYHLIVPRNAILDEIETVNGSVSIANAGNLTKASTVNGQVRAANLRGTANLSTVNGIITADFDQLPAGSKIALETVNGTVDLTIPSDANAIVKADTVNGKINNDFGLPIRKGEYVGKDLYGKLGSGDAQIKLNSVNGELSVRRRNDGKNLSPATNLLNLKNKDDQENYDKDESIYINTAQINKEIAKGMKQAQKEIAKMQPEIEKAQLDALKQANEEMNRSANTVNSEEMRERMKDAQERMKEAQAKRQAEFARLANTNWVGGVSNIEKKSETFTVKGTPKVTLDAKDCDVTLRGWDKSEVQYSISRVSKTRTPTPLDLKATQNNSDVDIKIGGNQNDDYSNETDRTRIEIFAPKKSNLKITTDGEIRLEGISGEVDLRGDDEAINVRDTEGKLSVTTADGRIRVIGFRGAFDGKTDDGTMNLEGDFQTFNATASDGTIILTLPENANAIFESNAEIESEGVNLIRDTADAKTWRVGQGGTTYRMTVDDGKIIVRSAGGIKTN